MQTNQKLGYFCLNESETRRFSLELVYPFCFADAHQEIILIFWKEKKNKVKKDWVDAPKCCAMIRLKYLFFHILGASEITANLCCNCVYLYSVLGRLRDLQYIFAVTGNWETLCICLDTPRNHTMTMLDGSSILFLANISPRRS